MFRRDVAEWERAARSGGAGRAGGAAERPDAPRAAVAHVHEAVGTHQEHCTNTCEQN